MLIVGLGSPHGDDQLGWVVVDRLRSLRDDAVPAIKVRDGAEMLAKLEAISSLLVVDASAPMGCPGVIRTFEWPSECLNGFAPTSSHGVGLVEALRLAEALGRMPRRVRIYAIEAESTAPGAAVSRAVSNAIDALVVELLRELDECAHDARRGEGS